MIITLQIHSEAILACAPDHTARVKIEKLIWIHPAGGTNLIRNSVSSMLHHHNRIQQIAWVMVFGAWVMVFGAWVMVFGGGVMFWSYPNGAHKKSPAPCFQGAGLLPGNDLLSQDLSSHYHWR
jgi:hypothetical protein